MKLARVATGRPAIIAFRYGFHGRTAPGDGADRGEGRLPRRLRAAAGLRLPRVLPVLLPGGRAAPHDPSACTCDWEAQLDLLFHQLVYPDKVAAIIVEPVIGEGGYIVPPPTFLPRLREITREHGILLIADEVQTGFGRTGEMFAVRHWDVEPDIVVMAKGIASGLPLSGILARKRADGPPAARARTAARTAATSSSCAAANATLDVIEDEGLVAQRARARRAAARRAAAWLRGRRGDRRRPRPRA